MQHLDGRPEVEKTSIFGTAVHVVLRNASTTPQAVREWIRVAGLGEASVEAVDPSLEDVFLDIVERTNRELAGNVPAGRS
jgi:hypothetical protein